MPLADVTDRGYKEFQRLQNWDGPVLYGHPLAVETGIEDSGILDVSRYAYLGGFDDVRTNQAQLTATWFADQGGVVALGSRQLVLSNLIANGARYRMPNLGPFVGLQWSQVGGALYQHQVQIIGTNRYHPLELVPNNAVMLDAESVALPASGSVTMYPADYYAGPLLADCTVTQTAQLILQFLDSTNTWRALGAYSIVANALTMCSFIVPPGAWRFAAVNQTAVAANVFLRVAHSQTGSS